MTGAGLAFISVTSSLLIIFFVQPAVIVFSPQWTFTGWPRTSRATWRATRPTRVRSSNRCATSDRAVAHESPRTFWKSPQFWTRRRRWLPTHMSPLLRRWWVSMRQHLRGWCLLRRWVALLLWRSLGHRSSSLILGRTTTRTALLAIVALALSWRLTRRSFLGWWWRRRLLTHAAGLSGGPGRGSGRVGLGGGGGGFVGLAMQVTLPTWV